MAKSDGKIVSAYLNSLSLESKRGIRKPATIKQQLDKITQRLNSERLGQVAKLKLLQKQADLNRRYNVALKIQSASASQKEIEKEFISVVTRYSKENGITNPIWRKMGVPANILIEAGLVKPRKRRA